MAEAIQAQNPRTRKGRPLITWERLKTLLHYDPETGAFTWQAPSGSRAIVGAPAGSPNDLGYVVIGIDGRLYRAHRLALFYMTGRWPQEEVDHQNGLPPDNRFENLREATVGQNRRNARHHRRSRSGLKGAHWDGARSRWHSAITVDGTIINLGRFDTAEEAHAAYRAAAQEHYGEFACFE